MFIEDDIKEIHNLMQIAEEEWKRIDNEVVSSRLKEIRKKKGLTMRELANICEVAYTTIQRYETNKVKYMQEKMIDKICRGLNIDIEYILGHRDIIQEYQDKDPIIYGDEKIAIRTYSIDFNTEYFKHTLVKNYEFVKEFNRVNGFSTFEESFVKTLQGISEIFDDNTAEMLLIMDRFYSEEVTEKDRNLIRAILDLPNKK